MNFDSQRMKVSLAAQTLSRSVTVALHALRDLGYSQFQYCETTAEFIEVISTNLTFTGHAATESFIYFRN